MKKDAMMEEINSIHKNDTREVTKLSKGKEGYLL